jgi:hypothetical protein
MILKRTAENVVRGNELELKWFKIRKMAIYCYSKENLEWN